MVFSGQIITNIPFKYTHFTKEPSIWEYSPSQNSSHTHLYPDPVPNQQFIIMPCIVFHYFFSSVENKRRNKCLCSSQHSREKEKLIHFQECWKSQEYLADLQCIMTLLLPERLYVADPSMIQTSNTGLQCLFPPFLKWVHPQN